VLRRPFVAILLAVALVACGETEDPAPRTAATPTGAPSEPAVATITAAERPRRRGRRITLTDSPFGRILADGRGQAVYLFDREQTGRSECYGACAKAWPPVLTRRRPVAGDGVRARRLGTARRRGGARQVTYRGQPLYYYVDDAPGRVLCHDVFEFGGLWLVIAPNGKPVA